MICGKCSVKNDDGSRFCSSCGSNLPPNQMVPPAKTSTLVDVILPLLDTESKRREAAKMITNFQIASLEEAQKLVEKSPVVLLEKKDAFLVQEIKQKFSSVGIELTIRSHQGGTADPSLNHLDEKMIETLLWLGIAIMLGFATIYACSQPDFSALGNSFKVLSAGAYLTTAGVAAYRLEWARSRSANKVFLRLLGITASLPFVAAGLLCGSSGILSCLSIIGILWGIPLMLLGGALTIPGIALCLPLSVRSSLEASFSRTVACPYCGTKRSVYMGFVSFKCGGCKQRVLIKGGLGVKIT